MTSDESAASASGLESSAAGNGRTDRIALALLLAGVVVAAVETKWLEVRGLRVGAPTPAAPLFLAFGLCLLLSYLAGRRVAAPEPTAPVEARPFAEGRSRLRRHASLALGFVSLMLFVATWILQSRRPVPLGILGAWLGSIVAAGAAFGLLPERASRGSRTRMHPLAIALLALLLAAGVWARIADLAAVPPILGGDEANQILDGIGLIRGTIAGTAPGDPFGTGWYGTNRLGMLLAGAGGLALPGPIAGPRLPFAAAGVLSLLLAARVGWLVAGTWGALGTAALLAFAPYSIHFTRLASVMVLDSLLATAFLALALGARSKGTPASGFWTGAVAGIALYGYSAGRVVPVLLVLAAPALVGSSAARGRRLLLAGALAAGFALAAAPGLRFAAAHFDDWNGRFNQVEIFRPGWWGPEVAKLGSPAAVLSRQVLAGTVGLLAWHTPSTWFKGYPMVGPFLLPSLAAAGLGWLFGRGHRFAAGIAGLLVAANLASVMLTDSAPAPQRLSSLFPALAILGGAALAGLVSLVGRPGEPGSSARATAGVVLIGAVLALSVEGIPPWWNPSPGYGGRHSAFALAASRVLSSPRYRGETVFLDALPYLEARFPTLTYLLPETSFVDRDLKKTAGERPPPGLHLISPDYFEATVPEWRERYGVRRAILLPDPDDPRQDIGAVVRVR